MTEVAHDLSDNSALIEENSASYVPLSARHGRVSDLFTLWFTTNIAPLPIVTGASIAVTSHLSLFWVASAIFSGHFLGGCVLAACSAQGPRMGLPQMIQSRGQFGRYGALLIVLISSLLYLGFFTSNTALGGRALHGLIPQIDPGYGAAIAALAAVAIGIFGYNTIHFLNRVGMWFMGAAILIAFVEAVHSLPDTVWTIGPCNLFGWFLCFSTALVWNTSYACYTSDYSRYLPETVGLKRPFISSLAGAAIGASVTFVFGAVLAASSYASSDPMSAVAALGGSLGSVLLCLFVLNIISHNALNVYGGVLTLITIIQTFSASWQPKRMARVIMSAVVLTGCLTVATVFEKNIVSTFINIVVALLSVLVPWVTVNILDFYVVKKGSYDIDSFFRADGGIYGLFDVPACLAFLAGVVVQLPVTSNAFFSGPLALIFNCIDIGCFISPPVSALVFLTLIRKHIGEARERLAAPHLA